MELHEFHVHEVRAGVVSQRVSIAGIFPAIAGDLVGATDSSSGHHDGPGLEQQESAALAVVSKRPHDTVSLFKERNDGALHVHVDSLMYAVILERPDHLQSRPVAYMCQTRVPVTAEISLKNISLFGAIEYRSPGFQLANAGGRFLRMEFGHAPDIDVLAAAHGIGKVNFPVVGRIHGRQ